MTSRTKVLQNTSELLPVRLTDAEQQTFGIQLAQVHADKRQLDADFDAQKSAYKDKEKTLIARAVRLADIVRTKVELREVPVEVTAHFDEDVVRVVRGDTGEVVHERPIRPEERQEVIAGIPRLASVLPTVEEKKKKERKKLEKQADGILSNAGFGAVAESDYERTEPNPDEPEDDGVH